MKVIANFLFILIIDIHNTLTIDESYTGNETFTQSEQNKNNFNNNGMWSELLEDYTVSKTFRTPKVMQTSHRYIPTSGFYITKRIGEAAELEPHMRPPGKVVLPQSQQQQNSQHFNRQSYNPNQPMREVTETDLYLLGAIEKLVYRVDYMENRLRRAEQMIYYLMAGNNQKEVREPCQTNFTKIGDNCYHLAGDTKINWKSANNACKVISSHLVEFENLSEMEDIVAYLLNHPEHRGKDFWLGGLNPGLLWIWSNSAKPINPNTNLTSVFTATDTINSTNIKSNNFDKQKNEEKNKILSNFVEIKGNGRCLRLSYNPARHTYYYYGQECTSRHHYLCEYEDKTLDNKIIKIARKLNL